jgi:hypothetical protein
VGLHLEGNFEFELFDLFLQVAQADAVPEQINEDNGECKKGEEERHTHVGCHGKTAFCLGVRPADDDRVNRAKQANGEKRDGCAEPRQGVDRAKRARRSGSSMPWRNMK